MPIQTRNPATGQVMRTFAPLTEDALHARIDLAAQGYAEHRRLPMDHRALCLRKLAVLLQEERAELAALITLEMGKPIAAAEAEIDKCIDCCRYYAAHAARLIAPEMLRIEGMHSYVQYEPIGVILAVMPWNFPFWQVFRCAVPTLMAGNTVLLKHAPSVPQCAMRIEGLVRQAGFVRGALVSLLIEVDAVETVLGDARVVAATVTGSPNAGRAVAAQAGYLLKKTVLELGGSDPFVIMPSASVEEAVQAAVRGRMVNGGQSCIAAKRFIIHNDLFADVQRGMTRAMERLRIGDPTRRETEVGPMASEAAVDTLEEQIKACVAAGGRILTGGSRLVGNGYFFEPTVIANVSRTAAVYHEEIFGPVALLFRANDLDDAIAIANETPFGLGAAVWTNEPDEQQRLLHELQCGMVYLNTIVQSDPRLPFGGTKLSGYGRELGAAGMREFMSAKTVVVSNGRR